ncbi:MAG: acetyl-CoA carboxylase biotin carboxylase subunit [Pseudomonadota bacterium]
MYKKILIANRGEIALRILRTCRELGIHSVAVHSDADASSMHVRLADESVCIGAAHSRDSYLNIPALLTAAELTGVDAIHPGIGFLAERADFAQLVEEHGYHFIGPEAEHITVMGDKVLAKQKATALGIPVVPGSEDVVHDIDTGARLAEHIGYPIILKASAGGGGRGMKIVSNREELEAAFILCQSEALAAFGDQRIYIEKFLQHPRHIEVQIIGDGAGGAIHLGERDCSVQRRHQKVIEEACSPLITAELRERIGNVAANAAAKLGYRGLGTIEFLYEDGQFYFIEMNTRLQIEHPVTEAVLGIDLVQMQIEAVANGRLTLAQEDVRFSGHAIECRINAEDPKNFMPSPGTVSAFHAPGGLGVRFDSHLYTGYQVPPYYDSLVGKLIVHASDRDQCITRTLRALDEMIVEGIHTNAELHRRILTSEAFLHHHYDINWLERWLEEA